MKIQEQFATRKSITHHINSSYILIFVTVLALILANSPFKDIYFDWWNRPIALMIGDFNIFSHGGEAMTVMQFINDALMAMFFFSVGLEIKREILVGELSSMKHAMLPVIGALGGMIVPVLVFRSLVDDPEILRGSAIPMATDIAFSLGVLGMLGKRVPIGLKVFLATLAVADDIGGIIVIAAFYSTHISLNYLLVAAILFIVLIVGGRKIHSKLFYLSIGTVIWFLFLNSGIHPTIAGVLIAFCIPARPKVNAVDYMNVIDKCIKYFPKNQKEGKATILSKEQINTLKCIETNSDRVISPLQDMEDSLHPLINFLIIPLFAFANAGVNFDGLQMSDLVAGSSLAVFLGLFVGKTVGIFSFSYIAIKTKIAAMPVHTSWMSLLGAAMLGGIGFTVALFIANLAYGSNMLLLEESKLGILLGSLISGIGGYIILNLKLPKKGVVKDNN